MTSEQIEYLEHTHDIYIDTEDMTYSRIGYGGIDQEELPEEWLDSVNYWD